MVLVAFYSQSALAWKMESRVITVQSTFTTPTFTSVSFAQTYSAPPLVFALTTTGGSDPSALRIRNVTNTGFEIAPLEPSGEDGPHVNMDVDILVIEPGSHTLPDGTRIEAGTVSTQDVQRGTGVGGPQRWTTVNFGTAFGGTPIVLAEIQTMNNESGNPPTGPSIPWLTAVVDNVGSNSFRVALERSEVGDGNVNQNETIAYFAMQSGLTGNFVDINSVPINYESILSGSVFDGWDNGCDTVSFSGGLFSVTPRVLATKATRNDNDGGWFRRCSLSTTRVGLTVDEDQRRDSERSHGNEQASIVAFSSSFNYDSTVIPAGPPGLDSFWKMESDTITMPAAPASTVINFRQAYDTAPLVFALVDNAYAGPADIRIRNVTTTNFEIVQVAPPGPAYVYQPLNVHYVAIEPGIHQLPDGTLIEAATKTTLAIQHGTGPTDPETWAQINFTAAFTTTPSVLFQIQGMANEPGHVAGTPSIPWLTTAVQNVTPASVQFALERSEVNNGIVNSSETVAYLAIDSGRSGNFVDNALQNISYETIRSADTILGRGTCRTVPFSASYANPLVIGNKATHDGGDGGWLRRCSLSNNNVQLDVDEDQDRDSERNHTTERASLLVFGQPFDAVFRPNPLAYYAMDETSWNATPDEVKDTGPNGYDGTGIGGATTDGATPAIVGAQGTCRYSELDGNKHYVDLGGGFPNLTGSFTVTAWIRAERVNQERRIFADDDNNSGGYALSLGDPGNGRLRFYSRSVNPANLDSPNVIARNTWHFVAAVHDASNKVRRIYVDGGLVAEDSGPYSGSWSTDPGNATIGGETDASAESNTRFRFAGSIDEVRVFDIPLTGSEVVDVMGLTHPCAVAVDRYVISHDNNGINCLAETIDVTAVDTAGVAVPGYVTSITLDTQTGKGSWVGTTGAGTLVDAIPNDGLATYTFDTSDGGAASFQLEYKEGTATFDVDVYETADPSLRDDDTEGAMTFRPFGFVVTPSPIGTQIAGRDFNLTLTAAGQTPSDPQCGVIETYDGSKNLKLWSNYIDPGPLTINGTPQVSIDGAPIATSEAAAADQNIVFSAGVATLTANYPDAGRIQLQAKDDAGIGEPPTASGDEVIGGVAPFIVRPFGFNVNVPGNPGATGPAGPVFIGAGVSTGDSFQADVTAVQWSAADDADNDGIPDGFGDADPSNNANLADNAITPNFGRETVPASLTVVGQHVHPAIADGGTPGGLSGPAALTATDGAANTGNTLRYSEVGVIELQIDTVNYFGTESVLGRSGPVGRFRPDHFVLSGAGGLSNRSDILLCGDPFTYMDEDFTVNFTLVARNADNGTTTNYENAGTYNYDKLLTGGTVGFGAIHDPGGANETPLTARLLPGMLAGAFTNGTADLTVPMSISRAATPDGAFSDMRVGVIPTDTDTVTLLNSALNLDPGVTGAATHAQLVSTDIRFGRAVVDNAFGSEFLSLSVPMLTQYYMDANNAFVTNNNDDCSTHAINNLTLFNDQEGGQTDGDIQIQPGLSTTATLTDGDAMTAGNQVDNGDAGLTFTAPLAPGYTDINLDVSAFGYLQFDWDGNGNHDNNPPTARATFGSFRGDDRIIYWQECFGLNPPAQCP
jgi:hypothetical protein